MTRLRNSLPVLLLAILVSILLTACSADQPRLSPLDSDATILAFGDSLTFGTGASKSESYPQVLAELIGHTVINAGVPGETTADGLARLPRVLEQTQPDLVILCLGGNDFLRRLDPALTRSNLTRMAQMIRGANVPLVMIAVPQLRLISNSDPLYQDLAKELKLPLENDILADVLRDRDLKSDPIHPNAKGYRRMAEAIAELLKTSGAV